MNLAGHSTVSTCVMNIRSKVLTCVMYMDPVLNAELFNNNVPFKNVYHLRGPAFYHPRGLVLQGLCRTYAMGCMNRCVTMPGY